MKKSHWWGGETRYVISASGSSAARAEVSGAGSVPSNPVRASGNGLLVVGVITLFAVLFSVLM